MIITRHASDAMIDAIVVFPVSLLTKTKIPSDKILNVKYMIVASIDHKSTFRKGSNRRVSESSASDITNDGDVETITLTCMRPHCIASVPDSGRDSQDQQHYSEDEI